MSSWGLVLPSGRSVREAQVTGRSRTASLLARSKLPEPLARLPLHTTFARLSAVAMPLPPFVVCGQMVPKRGWSRPRRPLCKFGVSSRHTSTHEVPRTPLLGRTVNIMRMEDTPAPVGVYAALVTYWSVGTSRGEKMSHVQRPPMLPAVSGNWVALAVRGSAAVLFGLTALIWPGLTLAVLIVVYGAYAVVDGAFALVEGLRTPSGTHKW